MKQIKYPTTRFAFSFRKRGCLDEG